MVNAGDFTANRMLYSWATVGAKLLKRLSGKFTDLQTLVIDFPAAASLVQSIVGSCTKLQNLTLELRGHNCDAGEKLCKIPRVVLNIIGIFFFAVVLSFVLMKAESIKRC